MHKTREYKGHLIDIHLEEVGSRWNWWYVIDGEHFTTNMQELGLTNDLADGDAFAHAVHRIDAGL